MLVSTIQQSESAVTYTYIPSFFGFSSPLGHQRAVSRVPWTIQEVPISHIYTRVWICFSMIPLADTECRMDWKGEESRSMEVREKSVVRGTDDMSLRCVNGARRWGQTWELTRKTDIRRKKDVRFLCFVSMGGKWQVHYWDEVSSPQTVGQSSPECGKLGTAVTELWGVTAPRWC